MRLLSAALLLLLLALCAARVDGECRRGPSSPSRPGTPRRQLLGFLGPWRFWVGTEGGRGQETPHAAEGHPALSLAGSKCKCSRKGPKIRYSDVKKLEMKPKYPHCEEKMVM